METDWYKIYTNKRNSYNEAYVECLDKSVYTCQLWAVKCWCTVLPSDSSHIKSRSWLCLRPLKMWQLTGSFTLNMMGIEIEIHLVLFVLESHRSQSTTLIIRSQSLSCMLVQYDPLKIKKRFSWCPPKCQSLSVHSSLPDHRTDNCSAHSYKSP